jgi:uncharacterized protein YecE (DUF72 family)
LSGEGIAQRNARYDYEYSDEELLQRVKGQMVLHTKTSLLAVAFNNHFQAKAVRNAIQNMRILSKGLGKIVVNTRSEITFSN